MPLPIGTRVGPYEITGALGAGGMGEVYRARDARLARDVALKVLPEIFAADPERLARFQREAQVLAALKHPNIGAIYGLEGNALVLELIEGETLADRVARGPVLPDEALSIAKQIAEALQAAHEQGIIHRDLKPSNIKVQPDGSVKVLDFGLAKLSEAGEVGRAGEMGKIGIAHLSMSPTLTSPAATGVGVVLGTAAYMAPEQAKGRPADKRSDVWSFGCVLYEMLTGRRAFEADDISDTLALVLKGEPDWKALPDDLPPSIRTLIRACLNRDRTSRLADVSAALFVLLHQSDLAPATPVQPAIAWMPLRRRIATVGAIVLAAATAGTGVWLAMRSSGQAVTRFYVMPPDETTFVAGGRPGTSAVISPDGRMLAFTARNSAGKAMLWLRSIDALTAQPIAGTDDAMFPFWSPDSRFIAFFTPDKLFKIAAAGGPPQLLCVANQGRGGTWSSQGQIVYGINGGPLFRVASAGGTPSVVTRVQPGAQDHRFPFFLPDARHLLFSVTLAQGAGGIWVASIDDGQVRRLADADTGAVYDKRDGYLLFGRQGSLMAQSFDVDQLELRAEPFRIAERLETAAYTGLVTFSVSSTGALAYGVGTAGNAGLQMVWVERDGKMIGTVGETANYRGIELSPDGKRIAARRSETAGGVAPPGDIWVTDVPRDTTSRFTFDASQSNASPIWSPDGSRIAFASFRSGKWGLYVKASNGAGTEERLLESSVSTVPVSWAPDGQSIMYISGNPKTRDDLWMLLLSGSRKAVALATMPFNEIGGQISPDGKWFAYHSDETGRGEIYVRPYPTGDSKWQISVGGGFYPRWRRDAGELFYLDNVGGGKMMAVDVKSNGSVFQAGMPKSLFDSGIPPLVERTPYWPYAVSADGQRFLIPRPASALARNALSPVAVVLNWASSIEQ